MLNWIISHFSASHFSAGQLQIGASVKTPHGTGRVIGGCLNVQLDKPDARIHRFSVSHPIEKIELL